MAIEADQGQSSNFPIPVGSTENPIRANHPRQLIIHDGNWEPCTDPNVLAGMDYLAVSYRQSDFPDKNALEKMVRRICFKRGIEAYWIDFACTGKTLEEKNEDLYRIADVFRNAKATLIVIKGDDGRPMSDGWLSWGMRIWTFPEALLSKAFIVQFGLNYVSNGEIEMVLNQIANHAYGSEDRLRKLIDLYSQLGKDFSKAPERIEMLCEAIWSRHSGPDSSVVQPSNVLTAYPGEKVYALMGFFLDRIRPVPTEGEDEAFKRLLFENGWDFDTYPGIAFKSGSARKLGVRDKKDTLAKESYVLPKHVPEARFDYNRGRRTCEEGTRAEILDKIFRWLGLDGHRNENDSTLNAESLKDVLMDVLWLKGLAGSGKSTIAQTAAEKCHDKRILGGSFFCSRSNEERSNFLNIFTTISYLLCQLDEDFKREVSKIYGNDKDLQRAEPDHQLKRLILEPLKAARQFPSCVIIIDALDECLDRDARSKILTALDKYLTKLKPLKFLITSRPDHDINVAFKTLSLGDDTERLDLDEIDPSLTDRDLRIVLTKGLTAARKKYYLPSTWPSEEDISDLVVQAQHLFIFVSTALKFIGDSSASDPKSRLDLLLKSQTITSKSSPYTYLDNLYREVFQTAFSEMEEELQKKLQMVLAILVLGREQFSISKLADFTELQPWTVRSTLSKLHALIVVPENEHENIRLIHLSIHDFLTDKDRCTDSWFFVNNAAGHSVIARCCLSTLSRFAESEEMRPFQQAPTRQKLESLERSIKRNEHSAIYYAQTKWDFHLLCSDLTDDVFKDFEGLTSNQHKFLFARRLAGGVYILIDLLSLRKTPVQPSSLSDLLPLPIFYQIVVFSLEEDWLKYTRSDKKLFWNTLEILHTSYGYKNGLFGLNERTAELEVVIFILKDFIPETDVPGLDATIHQLKKTAEETHTKIFQQTVPEDEKLLSNLMALMSKLFWQLSNVAQKLQLRSNVSDDYAIKLESYLFAVLYPLEAFNEIFDSVLNNTLYKIDNVLTEKFVKAFSAANDMQMDELRAILTVGLLGLGNLSFADMKALQPLNHLPTNKLYINLSQWLLFARTLVNDVSQIQLTYPSLFSTFFDKAKYLNNHFLIDPVVEHSKLALHSMEKLIEYVSIHEVQPYRFIPAEEEWNGLRDDLKDGDDAALTYAYRYWVFHIDKSDGQLDESALRLLGELVSNHCTLDFFIENADNVISRFLSLFNKFLCRPSPPFNAMGQLFKAAVFLCGKHWPDHIENIEKYVESIKDTRATLKTHFLYKDGLYDLHPDFPLLSIALLKLANFIPRLSQYELMEGIRKLRYCTNELHGLIMEQDIPKNENDCLALRVSMSTLYEGLTSSYKTYIVANRDIYWDNREYTQALRIALSTWIKSLIEFWIEVHNILGIPDNIEPSKPPIRAIIGATAHLSIQY